MTGFVPRTLVSEATALPIEPQPLPNDTNILPSVAKTKLKNHHRKRRFGMQNKIIMILAVGQLSRKQKNIGIS